MKYKQIDNKYFFRLEKGEELIETIKKFCVENNIKLGQIEGIGSTNKAVCGVFNTMEKKFMPIEFDGDMEITSLLGNISEKDGQTYLHAHINMGKTDGVIVGGHLSSAVISGTFEGIITTTNGNIDRFADEETGLNLWKI